jgi:Trk K+ transport system NAD-binding subunit
MEHQGHAVVCGFDGIAVRIIEELRELDEKVVVVVGDPGCALAIRARELGIDSIDGDYRDPVTLSRAGVERAEALAIVNDHDANNLHAALTAQELKPDLNLAVRMFDTQVGERLEKLFVSCRIISTSEVAAPAFASAALFGNSGQCFTVKGKTLQFRAIEPGDEVISDLAGEDEHETLHLFSENGRRFGLVGAAEQTEEDGVAASIGYQVTSAAEEWKARARGTRELVDRRLLHVFVFVVGLGVLSTLVFWLFTKLNPLEALYFTVTTISTVGFGDVVPGQRGNDGIEVYTIGLMIVSALTLVVFYALFTDVIVGARLARTLGAYPCPKQDHVVVCGLGSIGYRVVTQLVSQGVPCVVIEHDADSRFLLATKRLKVPVVIGDATRHGVLEQVHLMEARAVMAVTSEDMANVQTALAARDIAPQVRIVLRIFDADFAERIGKAFSMHISRSVAGLAAPAFVDALMRRRFLATVPVGSDLLAIRELTVHRRHPFAERPIGEIGNTDIRVLAVGGQWAPDNDRVLHAGDELTVIRARRRHPRAPTGEKQYA